MAVLDALDEAAVDAHADAVVAAGGSLDIAFNLISFGDVQGTPMAQMAVEDYMTPVLTLGALDVSDLARRRAAHDPTGHGRRDPRLRRRGRPAAGPSPRRAADRLSRRRGDAPPAQRRERRPGIRVVTLRTGGIPETLPSDMPRREAIAASLAGASLLGRAATLAEVGQVAAFVASDQARSMTAATVNLSAGALLD